MKNVLHLSDFHLTDVPSGLGRSQNQTEQIIRLIVQDTKKLLNGSGVDTVVITGDLAFHGRQAEYSMFQKVVVEKLQTEFSLTCDDFIVCPGNHDVELSARSMAEKMIASSVHGGNTDEEAIAEFDREVALLDGGNHLASMSAYRQFIREHKLGSSHLKKECGLYSYYRIPAGADRHIRVIALNSSYTARGGEADSGKLHFPTKAFDDSLDDVKQTPGEVGTIVLIHHPLDWLRRSDKDALNRWIRKNSTVTLMGHIHTPDGIQESGATDSILKVLAGSCDKSSIKVRYNIICFDSSDDIKSGKVYFRCLDTEVDSLSNQKTAFAACKDVSENGNITFDLAGAVYFDIDDLSKSAKALKDEIDRSLLVNVRSTKEKPKTLPEVFDMPKFAVDQLVIEETTTDKSKNGIGVASKFASSVEVSYERVAGSNPEWYFIIGSENYGKSTVLKHIHYKHLLELESRSLSVMSFYVDLRTSKIASASDILDACISQYEGREYRGAFRSKIINLIDTGRVIFLLDNIDLSDADMCSIIVEFSLKHAVDKFIMTASDSSNARIACRNLVVRHLPKITLATLLEARRTNLRQLVAKLTGDASVDEQDEAYETVIKTIKNSYLPHNNFIYTLLCEIYLEKKKLNSVLTEADIVENYIEMVLRKHCVNEEKEVDKYRAPYKTILNFIGYCCVSMIRHKATDLSQPEIQQLAIDYNKMLQFPYQIETYWKPLLDSGLLLQRHDRLLFSQRCFFDYSCAQYIESDDVFKALVLSEEYYLHSHKILEYYSALGNKNNRQLIDLLVQRVEIAEQKIVEDYSKSKIDYQKEVFELLRGRGLLDHLNPEILKTPEVGSVPNREDNDKELDDISPLAAGPNRNDLPIISKEQFSLHDRFDKSLSLCSRVIRNSVHIKEQDYRELVYTKVAQAYFKQMCFSMLHMKRDLATEIEGILVEYLREHGRAEQEIEAAKRMARGFMTVFLAFVPRIVQRIMTNDLGSSHQEILLRDLIKKHESEPDIASMLRMFYVDGRHSGYLEELKRLAEYQAPYNLFSVYLKACELLKYDYKLSKTDRSSVHNLAVKTSKSATTRSAISYIENITAKETMAAKSNNTILPTKDKGEKKANKIPPQRWHKPGPPGSRW